MNRAELVNSLTKKGFRPDGAGGFTKEPLSKSNVISHEKSLVVKELPDSKPKSNVRKTLEQITQNEEGSKRRTIVRFTRKASRLLDTDNLYGSQKFLLDCLRYCGEIEDDNPETIELQCLQEKVSKSEQGTLIEIIYG